MLSQQNLLTWPPTPGSSGLAKPPISAA